MPKSPIYYVTRSRERAEGMVENESYQIIADSSKDTLDLLSNPQIQQKIEENNASVLLFKNTLQIERLAKEKSWKLLNPSAELAEKIENKITQVEWLGNLASLLPPHHLVLTKKVTKNIFPKHDSFILQWAHSHTGEGTIHIKKESELHKVQKDFPDRETRVTEYIKGPMFTVNIVVSPEKIVVGNISYQITGLEPFTDNLFSTIGNDWSLPPTILSESHLNEFNKIAVAVAEKFQSNGWKGLFGIDVIYAEEQDKLYLIEINARQPASTTYESQLQSHARELGVPGMTTFEAHLAALTGQPISDLVIINDGAQIIQRVTKNIKNIDTTRLEQTDYQIVKYSNNKLNSDLIRIQSKLGIMETHNKFNKRGKEIESLLKP